MGEGPGFVGFGGDLIEDQTTGFIDGDAALHQIVRKPAFEVQATCQIVDGGDAVTLCLAGAGGDGLGGERLARAA